MSGIIPPIPPPLFGTSSSNPSSPNVNRVDTMPNTETMNSLPTINVSRSVDDDLLLPQFLNSRGGSHITNVPIINVSFKALEGEKVNGTYTRLKCLLNDLKNNGVIISQSEINVMFVNSLPRKWLSMNQTQRANNSIKNDSVDTLYGKYHYEEGDSDLDVEEDNRTNNEFMADLNAEYHERALLENQKRFYKRSGGWGQLGNKWTNLKRHVLLVGNLRIDELTKGKDDKGKGDKRKSDKRLVAESFEWDDESVSLEDEETTKFKAFMAIADDVPSVGKGDV
ncbi:hypothetical protein Tco_1520545 [Tanacetum coccineum]